VKSADESGEEPFTGELTEYPRFLERVNKPRGAAMLMPLMRRDCSPIVRWIHCYRLASAMATIFTKLNDDWNAEPNAPDPVVQVSGKVVVLEFTPNPRQFPRFSEDQRVRLIFRNARRYRLGSTNDEGWYHGQCRFSGIAPEWGEFYELTGELKLDDVDDWCVVDAKQPSGRHFLFYRRDETFECEADDWRFETTVPASVTAT
jgi:hypothetical protein